MTKNENHKTDKNLIIFSEKYRIQKLKLAENKVGNFLLEKTIGEGTFGKVYSGIHLPTKEKV